MRQVLVAILVADIAVSERFALFQKQASYTKARARKISVMSEAR